jgi:hypothetical protein
MVRHDAVRIKCHAAPFDRCSQHAHEGVVIGSAIEKQRAFRGSVDNVIDDARDMFASSAWHEAAFQRNADADVRIAARSVLNK